MNSDFWILWIPLLVPCFMLSVALASLSAVEKKQEEHDEKLDKLECQLARLENRLESRFKLPDVDPSTLDTKYMTLDEMDLEAGRLHNLISNARDIRDKESILKGLRDAQDKLKKWEDAYVEQLCYIDPESKKYRRNKRLREREEKLCRWSLGPLSSTPDRHRGNGNGIDNGKKGKGNGKNGKGKRIRPKNRRRTDSRPCHAPTDDFLVCQSGNRQHPSPRQHPNQRKGLKSLKRIAVIALGVFAGLLLASGTVAFSPRWKTCELWSECILVPGAKLLRESADGWESLESTGILNKNRFATHKPRPTFPKWFRPENCRCKIECQAR